MSSVTSWEEMRALVADSGAFDKLQAATNYAAQIWAFVGRIAVDDIVVMPIKNTPYLAIGRVTGPYRYDAGQEDRGRRHVRDVDWVRTDVPRTEIRQDLLYSLGAFLTVCQIHRNDAAWRLQQVLETGRDPGSRTALVGTGGTSIEDSDLGDELSAESSGIDILRYSKDRITARVGEVFAGHALSNLVAAVLEAQGFRCWVSPPGPDGGVDILVGTGVLGMDSPRLVVQVKSQTSPVSNTVVQQLQGAVAMHKADQGLLVAWGGLTKPARDMLTGQHFHMAVWTSDDVIDEVTRHYDALPDEIQVDLPLQRAWILVEEDAP
ncbi:MAG: restriction endonuclease [Actinomycetales bacterium]|nr:restriction endonuclease [Actinomycetales bacterium]